jgi:hypothetical protein
LGKTLGRDPAIGSRPYTLGPDGWELYVNVDARAVLGFLETTTDYDARRPTGPPAPPSTTNFDWTGSAHFIAMCRCSTWVM